MNQDMFNYFQQEHGVTLVESQADEIFRIVNAHLVAENQQLAIALNSTQDKNLSLIAHIEAMAGELEAAKALAPKPVPPKKLTRWYMLDNHTFIKLPDDNAKAMAALLMAFDGPCGHYGMLCARYDDDSRPKPYQPEHSADDWSEFKPHAQQWLEDYPALPTTPKAKAEE